MKYIYQILFAVVLFTSSFTFSEKEKSTFDFLIKKTENKIVDARFQLTSNIDYLQVQKALLKWKLYLNSMRSVKKIITIN